MNASRYAVSLFVAGGALLFSADAAWCQSRSSQDCLTAPIDVAISPHDAGDKARSAGKSLLGGLLSQATGGAVSTGGGEKPKLAHRPKYPKSKLNISDSDLQLEYQGALDDGELRMAVRIRKDHEKGSPHLVVLQDINCRVLLPSEVEVFELWSKGSLSVSWSSSTYQNGSLVGTDSGGWDTSWADLRERYPSTSEIPGIWQTYGEPPFKGIRGVTATFQPPPGETFHPEDWYLVTHVTSPSSMDQTITTEPVVTEFAPGAKKAYSFFQASNVSWNPPAVQPVLTMVADMFATSEAQDLVCKKDCQKVLDEIDRLECAKDDCSDEKAAVDAALAALADAQQALQSAENAAQRATADIGAAQQALDLAISDQAAAERKLAVESAKQKRLQESLARGGLGLSPAQTQHGVEFSRGVVEGLEQDATNAQAAANSAHAALNAANASLQAANAAVAGANARIDSGQQDLDAARKALSDCMQRDWERCRAIDQLWQEYQDCRKRCRDQEEARSGIDHASGQVKEGQQDMGDAADDYDRARQAMNEANAGTADLGGDASSAAQDLAGEAAEARRRAKQLASDAGQKLREAESDYERGDLDGATKSAEAAIDLQQQAGKTMEDAADRMRAARDEAGRRYQDELDREYLRRQREWAEQRRAAALKKQACMRHLAEYFAHEGGNNTLLEELGGFVGGDARNALDEARGSEFNPEKVQEFLDKAEEMRHRLEQLLTLLNGIGDNASMESRNEAFGTAIDIAGEIAERIPGLGEFFNFYSSAYNTAVQALYALQNEILDKYKPLVDNFIRTGANCCSYTHEQLDDMSLDDVVNQRWERFRSANSAILSGISPDTLRKLEDYFKTRFMIRWTTCCIEYILNG